MLKYAAVSWIVSSASRLDGALKASQARMNGLLLLVLLPQASETWRYMSVSNSCLSLHGSTHLSVAQCDAGGSSFCAGRRVSEARHQSQVCLDVVLYPQGLRSLDARLRGWNLISFVNFSRSRAGWKLP